MENNYTVWVLLFLVHFHKMRTYDVDKTRAQCYSVVTQFFRKFTKLQLNDSKCCNFMSLMVELIRAYSDAAVSLKLHGYRCITIISSTIRDMKLQHFESFSCNFVNF